MEYTKFYESILTELKRMLGDDYTVKVEKVLKNNQVSYDAIIIMRRGKTMAPSIYLNDYYEEYKAGRNVTDIALSIIVRYEKYKDGITFDVERIAEYKNLKGSIFVKVINADMNEKLLENLPHMKYFDLAMIAYAVLDDDNNTRITMNVSYGNLQLWNIDKEILFKDAINNTRKKLPPRYEKMSNVMKELLASKIRGNGYKVGDDEEMDALLLNVIESIELSDGEKVYVLTNSKNMDGAVYILFNDVLEDIAQMLQNDIYIIPSSIHEIMILPRNGRIDYENLCEMVNYVNSNDLDPMEILSNHVYIYERGKGIQWKNSAI